MIAVSLCLTGAKCRYDGKSKHDQLLLETIGDGYLAVCPEVCAGLAIPRPPSEISGGCGADVLSGKARVVDRNGRDITEAFLEGSRRALEICLENGVTTAYLRARSPSCGCGSVYDGSFTGTLTGGNGVFAELLLRNGIEVIAVEQRASRV